MLLSRVRKHWGITEKVFAERGREEKVEIGPSNLLSNKTKGNWLLQLIARAVDSTIAHFIALNCL
jgi:hypothetical protein